MRSHERLRGGHALGGCPRVSGQRPVLPEMPRQAPRDRLTRRAVLASGRAAESRAASEGPLGPEA